MNRKTFLAATALTALDRAASGMVGARAAIGIEELLPFAGTASIHIPIHVSNSGDAAALNGVVLDLRIEEWSPRRTVLWEKRTEPIGYGTGRRLIDFSAQYLTPKLWDLQTPHLYRLIVTALRDDVEIARRTVRFGFRSFTTHDGRFFLNGRPTFLRGNAINAPGRGLAPSVLSDKAFALAYLRDLKTRNINLVRLGADTADIWLDACDEVGMLVFQGRYGAPPGGSATAPPTNVEKSIARYKEDYFSGHVRHPSVVINILSNEMPPRGAIGEAYAGYFDRVYTALRAWDPNRLYIDNAGFGHGRSGDINDQHPYDGWYGGTFVSYYRYRMVPAKVQPITLSETVGSYTQSDGHFQIAGKQLAAALTWAGHTETPQRDGYGYQAFLAGQIIESFRRMRSINPRLAGVMPFTGIFDHWVGVSRFEKMGPKPVADQMRTSYQPVLLSWELWTPQVYAGTTIRPVAHIVNDADDGSDLTGAALIVSLTKATDETILHETRVMFPPVPYYAAKSLPIELPLPGSLPSGDYVLRGRVERSGMIVSANRAPLFIAGAGERPAPAKGITPLLYDPAGKTGPALSRIGIHAQNVSDLAALPSAGGSAGLIVAEGAWSGIGSEAAKALRSFVEAGGRVLLLRQEPDALAKNAAILPGVDAHFTATAGGMWINPERPDHPVFAGIPRERLRWWSDPSGWDQTRPDLPTVAPVTLGFALAKPEDLGRTAILADFGRGLINIALGEVFAGKGSILVCGFDLVSRISLDPVADCLLYNLAAYNGTPFGHHAAPLIDGPIVWGDYSTERGIVGGPQYGLLVNASSDPDDHSTTVGLSDRISVPDGRRPFGPFSYNGNCHIVDGNPDSPTGSGFFFARLPAGRTRLATTVRNPQSAVGQIAVEIDSTAAAPVTVPGGETITFVTPLLRTAAETVSVRYVGAKSLVLVRTEFFN